MHTLEDLSFYAIPAIPRCSLNPPFAILLNLFAGQLYLKSCEEYLSACRFLGLASRPPDEQNQVAGNEFISPTSSPGFDKIMEITDRGKLYMAALPASARDRAYLGKCTTRNR